MLINCCQARSCLVSIEHFALSYSDFLTEHRHFLDGLGCQTFLDALAAKRIDALLNLPAQIHADLGCQTDVALYLSERESAVGMLFQCLSSITGHTAKTLFSKAKKLEFSEVDGELAVA